MAAFSKHSLELNADREIGRIAKTLVGMLTQRLMRRGGVVGLSGGIDSSVVAALCVRALGKERVLGIHTHERESSDETRRHSNLIAGALGITTISEEIAPLLDAAGCYQRRDEAIKSLIPDYASDWKSKIVLPNVVDSDTFRIFSVVVQSPDNRQLTARLTPDAYLSIVAATSFKQRVRKMIEYHHADRLNYAVTGTANLLNYDQGFFVKNGDGAADINPIVHLYKTQVYQLAEALGVPEESAPARPRRTRIPSRRRRRSSIFLSPTKTMDLLSVRQETRASRPRRRGRSSG